jgi:hypothetical protein
MRAQEVLQAVEADRALQAQLVDAAAGRGDGVGIGSEILTAASSRVRPD